ncbi:hypothetical protein LUZ60_013972 [Juncus effusus]|nr:hypothetical protein LUZ60_013972 [Juncus effusus]
MEAPPVRMRLGPDSSRGSPNTGLEDSMQRLELGEKELIYPERPGEPDCVYFLRNGSCGYGDRCRYNHPRGNISLLPEAEEYPDRPGHPVCEYYLKNGSCKFGSTCKYHHPKQASTGPVQSLALNSSGFPLRMGEKECTYYIKTGNCKYGQTCKYHHPEKPLSLSLTNPVPPPPPPVFYQPSPVVTSALYSPVPPLNMNMNLNLNLARFQVLPRSYGPVLVQPGGGIVPAQTWNPYMGAVNPLLQPNTAPLFYNLPHQIGHPSVPLSFETRSVPVLPVPVPTMSGEYKEQQMPAQRGNQTLCHHYLNKGYCKYGTGCKYHHVVPFSTGTERSNCALSPLGLPLRPGAEACGYYAKHGVCKYGPTCKFDHPMGTLSYTPSASSLSDVPVSPYPLSLPYNSSSNENDFYSGAELSN